MAARVLDGKALAAEIRKEVGGAVRDLVDRRGVRPGLAAVLVGDDPASVLYVRNKRKACEEAGIKSWEYQLPADLAERPLLDLIAKLNADPAVHGILVQLPLPAQIHERTILEAVRPEKDIDGFTCVNFGRLALGEPLFVPCTPAGILEILDRSGIPIAGSHAVVVGRSEIVGKPAAMLLLHRHATVSICHSRTPDLGAMTRQADILVVAVGRARLIRGEMVKEGAAVIDVGISRVDGKLVGDVDFATAKERAAFITPVPGGVGPLTIAMLLRNTLRACERSLAS